MKHRSTLIILILTFVVNITAVFATDSTTYGAGLTLDKPIAIADLIKDPDSFVDKMVQIEGVVTGVCAHRGCWMVLTDSESGQGLRIKVTDGVIVFPPTAMGHKAKAEGTFKVFASDKKTEEKKVTAQCSKEHEHKEEKGSSCSPKPIDDRVLMIMGTGAVIY